MSMFGIDISSYQRGIDIKGTGARFCICKATDGTRFVDKTCDGFIQQCRRDGILFGFYHFANSPTKSSWEQQAEYFVRNCHGYFGDGVPVLDWEDSSYGGPVRKYGPAGARRFLDEVYRLTGVRPMIYMSASTCTEWDWSQVARDYALWGAGYRNGATYDNPRTSSYSWGAFKSPVIHQYAESGGLDKNVGYLTAEQWEKFANPGKVPTAQPETVPEQRPSAADTINVDGWVGPSTVRKWQQVMGTAQDGVISGQPSANRKYHKALTSVRYEHGYSSLVKAVQGAVGTTQDGWLGPSTIRAIQGRVGAAQDGYFGNETARKLQERLNEGRF